MADKQQAPPTSSGNVWTSNRLNSGRSGRSPSQTIPVRFNNQEAQDLMRKVFSSTTTEEEKPARYKAPSARAGNKSGTPWAAKPHTMGNGKDFFLDLRKQISALQQSERAGG